MIKHELLREDGILIVTPESPLSTDDFESVQREVDPYIETHGRLKGLMVYTSSFPGWENFAALLSHLKFIRDHHRKIQKVAAVTDSKVLTIAPKIASHFVEAEIRHFDYGYKQQALAWLKE